LVGGIPRGVGEVAQPALELFLPSAVLLALLRNRGDPVDSRGVVGPHGGQQCIYLSGVVATPAPP
jgi:hypothetical protein